MYINYCLLYLRRSGGGYLTATAALSRGGELDLSAQAPADRTPRFPIEHRKSILVNGYPVSCTYRSCHVCTFVAPH